MLVMKPGHKHLSHLCRGQTGGYPKKEADAEGSGRDMGTEIQGIGAGFEELCPESGVALLYKVPPGRAGLCGVGILDCLGDWWIGVLFRRLLD